MPATLACPKCREPNHEPARQCGRCGKSLELAALRVVEGTVAEAAFILKPRGYTIGRSPDNDIVLADPSVSRYHARLEYSASGFSIEDQGSRHGIRVGGAGVKQALLESGQQVEVGSVVFRFNLLDPDASTAAIEPKAARGQRDAAAAGAAAEGAAHALDRLQLGIVLLAGDGSVVFANRSARAILDEADGLGIEQGALRASDAATRRQLRQVIGESTSTRGGALTVPRAARRPLNVLVSPLGPQARGERPPAAKVLFISDPERGIATGEENLQRLYGLTPAEARLTGQLLQGRSLDEAASELAITPHTARSYLKSVFSKTGARRQSDLVRLLLSGPAQVRGD
jgi:DNA-binding CsgD family transcriptional regulator/PAS domain-containing protein